MRFFTNSFFFLVMFFAGIPLLYSQGFYGYSWGTARSLIISNEGSADYDSTLGQNESVLEYNNRIISGYYTTVVYIFINNKLYLGNYLFDDLTKEGVIKAYNDLFNKLTIKYGNYYQRDTIINNTLDPKKSPYKIIWNYNEQLIQLSLTYKITGQWGVSIRYLISPQLALIASGGKIRDYKNGDL